MSFIQGLVKMKEITAEITENKAKSTPIAMVAPEMKQNTDDTEITKTCAVLGCEDSKNLDADSFFRFPEDSNLRQIWTDLTGRNSWTPTDYSYMCIQHFSVDCFTCDANNKLVLVDKAVPSLKLPRHVLEVEYIDEETLENEYDDDYDMDVDDEEDVTNNHKVNGDTQEDINNIPPRKIKEQDPVKTKQLEPVQAREQDALELLKLFSEVQKLQRQAVSLRDKLKSNVKLQNRQKRFLERLKEIIEIKKNILKQKKEKKSRILLSLQDKMKEDTNGLVLAMPSKHTDDLKNFALSIYKYSPQAYIYIRNTLRTMLPNTEILDSWISSGYQPKNVLASNVIKVVAEQTETELSCRIMLG